MNRSPTFLKTIFHQWFCHFYLWQSIGRSPQRVTKPVTVRHFHSLPGKRRDIFESAAPLSDMAVPKALPITVGGEEPATLQRPICKQNHWETFPTRHHLAATHTCLRHSLIITGFSIYRLLSCPPTHTLHLVKQQPTCSKLKNILQAFNHQCDRCQHISQ